MDIRKFRAERQWVRNQLSNVADFWLKNGWDHEFGGILYFLDCLGNPPEAYEHEKEAAVKKRKNGRCAAFRQDLSNYPFSKRMLRI